MKLATIAAAGMLVALSIGRATAEDDGTTDPIAVTTDQAVVVAGNEIGVNVAVGDALATYRPKASLIIYKPDGTMLKARARSMRKANTKFRLLFGTTPQIGTYTVYATVEHGPEGFGLPTTFEITAP